MKDFLGNPLAVGDSVILIAPNYRSLVTGRIISQTPKNFRVAFLNTWNYGPDGHRQEILQASTQLVKVNHDTTYLEPLRLS